MSTGPLTEEDLAWLESLTSGEDEEGTVRRLITTVRAREAEAARHREDAVHLAGRLGVVAAALEADFDGDFPLGSSVADAAVRLLGELARHRAELDHLRAEIGKRLPGDLHPGEHPARNAAWVVRDAAVVARQVDALRKKIQADFPDAFPPGTSCLDAVLPLLDELAALRSGR